MSRKQLHDTYKNLLQEVGEQQQLFWPRGSKADYNNEVNRLRRKVQRRELQRQEAQEEEKAFFRNLNIDIPTPRRRDNLRASQRKRFQRVLRDIETKEIKIKEVPFEEKKGPYTKKNQWRTIEYKNGFRQYKIENLNIDSSDKTGVFAQVLNRVVHAKRTGFTQKAHMNVKLNFKLSNSDPKHKGFISHTFPNFDLDSFDNFKSIYSGWSDMNLFNNPNSDYTQTIQEILITMIPENSGGCHTGEHDKITHENENKLVSYKTRGMINNCFFKCVHPFIPSLGKRLSTKKCNQIREEFKINPDAEIPISIALEIFQKYKQHTTKLIILDADTMETHQTEGSDDDIVFLELKNNHYRRRFLKKLNKCNKCLKEYRKTHTCNQQRIAFVNRKIKKTGKRYLIYNKNMETNNTSEQVLHFDLETYRVKLDNGDKVHKPYIVGYTDVNDGHKFKYIAGKDCMERFAKVLIDIAEKSKETIYINAFNGSRFDHYFLYKELLNRNIKTESTRNNGAIISCEYKKIRLIDLSNHLTGSLRANLESLKCKVQKGDFDHDKASAWEDMREEMKQDCLKYLEADVLGLKELYDKLNKSIFDKTQANISSYLSTSSLTFNLWKRRIKNYDIQLPTLEQEPFFRTAVKGARCYPSKKRFLSGQYEGYKNGDISFDELKDYMIDADVVSLYPAAMANFQYPVGDCFKLAEGENEMKGKMGIYKIRYKTNKNLAHAILARRTKTGLKWDLYDGEGVYSSVEIEDAIANGYQIEILGGWYWEETAPIFKEYIDELFTEKEQLAKEGKKGSAEYLLAKLWMNGLYGKMIQRPIFTESKNIKTTSEYWKFYRTHHIESIHKIAESLWEVAGTPRELDMEESRITKPTHIGGFILAHSRRIMLGYMKEANPYFDHEGKYQKEQLENDIHYTDTDSLQMRAECAKRIKNLGKKSLGMITDDLGDDCKIVRGIWISPKLYMLEFTTRDASIEGLTKQDLKFLGKDIHIHHANGSISQNMIDEYEKKNGHGTGEHLKAQVSGMKSYYHFRGKGLPAKKLSVEIYEQMDEGQAQTLTRDFQMKKIHVSRNSKQQHIPMFSIQHLVDVPKTVNKESWDGRQFDGNDSKPWFLP